MKKDNKIAKQAAAVVDEAMDKLWDKNQWDEATIEAWKNEHYRRAIKKDAQPDKKKHGKAN